MAAASSASPPDALWLEHMLGSSTCLAAAVAGTPVKRVPGEKHNIGRHANYKVHCDGLQVWTEFPLT